MTGFWTYIHYLGRTHAREPEFPGRDNACVLLQEENLFRIERFSSPTRLSIQLLRNSPENLEGASLDPQFVEYLYEDYLSSTPKDKLSTAVFLKRNLRKYPGDEDERYCAALEGVQILNGLEIRLSPTTYKMQYFSGTEDVSYRRKNVHRNGFSCDHTKSSNKFRTKVEKSRMCLSSKLESFI